METLKKLNRVAGFTLLELIISITLVAIIVLIISVAANLGYRSFNSGEKKMNAVERLRSSLTIIDAQIQSGVPLTSEDGGVKQYNFMGEQDSLNYRVDTDDRGKRTLFASEYKVGMENQKETKLLEGFDEITFDYYKQDATEEEGEWITQWVDEEMMPTRIRINLVRGSNSLSYIMPVRVGGAIGESDE
jgi:general secretion pathway protein J